MNPFPRGQYGVIYVDPPWQYRLYSEKGYEKAPEAHYETMNDDDLIAMRDDILFAAAPDCVLVMWGVWPKLPMLTDLAREWGFKHCTGGAWSKITKHGKQAFGPGYVLRSASEPFTISTIGRPNIKNHSTRNQFHTGEVPSDLREIGITIDAITREHSRKPDEMVTLIEELFEGPYLELFARTERPGWTVWGNETEKFKEAA